MCVCVRVFPARLFIAEMYVWGRVLIFLTTLGPSLVTAFFHLFCGCYCCFVPPFLSHRTHSRRGEAWTTRTLKDRQRVGAPVEGSTTQGRYLENRGDWVTRHSTLLVSSQVCFFCKILFVRSFASAGPAPHRCVRTGHLIFSTFITAVIIPSDFAGSS